MDVLWFGVNSDSTNQKQFPINQTTKQQRFS